MSSAFLCHASEDKRTVERLARELMSAGIDTFFDQWEIRSGDSLRQRIDAGIDGCTHFIVVLSSLSLTKPWVNAELDAGFIAKLNGRAHLIPLRLGIAPEQMPALLRGLKAPSLDDFETTSREVVSDILGITQRPPLGSIPTFATRAIRDDAGLSTLAGRIAAYLVQTSKKARFADPQLSVDELRKLADANDDDIAEAVDELESRGWVSPTRTMGAGQLGFVRIMPQPRLFADLDGFFMPWNPEEDARTIAAEILNSSSGSVVAQLLSEQLGWTPRRINPAITILVERGVVDGSKTMDADFQTTYLRKNVQTRRFVRES